MFFKCVYFTTFCRCRNMKHPTINTQSFFIWIHSVFPLWASLVPSATCQILGLPVLHFLQQLIKRVRAVAVPACPVVDRPYKGLYNWDLCVGVSLGIRCTWVNMNNLSCAIFVDSKMVLRILYRVLLEFRLFDHCCSVIILRSLGNMPWAYL